MNVNEAKARGEAIAQDLVEQIENLRHIKGERYALCVDYSVKVLSMNHGVASMFPKPEGPKDIMGLLMVAKLMTEAADSLLNMFFHAAGIPNTDEGKAEAKEIMAEANRMFNACMERAKS